MPDYNLNGLDPRSFEQFVQAIAKKEIGNGVTPFGDGPDGGREATFNGKMNYPSTAAPWDGYLVIQSKFKLHPTGNPKEDGDWLIEQLSKDLAKFLDAKRSLKRPEAVAHPQGQRLAGVAGQGWRRVGNSLPSYVGGTGQAVGHARRHFPQGAEQNRIRAIRVIWG